MLGTSPDGLEADKAAARLASGGPNRIAKEDRPSVVKELWGRAKNPLNALLLSLATASYFLGDLRAAIVILIMVVLAITTAFVQEHRSNDAAAKLRAMVKTTASVKRRGAAFAAADDQSQGFAEIAIDQLVPGDLVRLSAGDMIPADLRLISAKDLFVNQAALTGEAMPSEKTALPVNGGKTDPFDFSVILSREDGTHVLICKGAVEEVFSVCKHYELGDELGTLDAGHLAQAQVKTKELNEDGFRVVAVAYKEMRGSANGFSVADENDLTLLGYIAFLDPPKESAGPAIRALNKSGVAVKIIAGDNEIITRKICREVGLDVDRIVLGPEIEKLSDAELAELAPFNFGLRQSFAGAKGPGHRRTSCKGPRRRVSRRRHQRQSRPQGRRRRRIGRQRCRHCQGIRRHHPAEKSMVLQEGVIEGRFRSGDQRSQVRSPI